MLVALGHDLGQKVEVAGGQDDEDTSSILGEGVGDGLERAGHLAVEPPGVRIRAARVGHLLDLHDSAVDDFGPAAAPPPRRARHRGLRRRRRGSGGRVRWWMASRCTRCGTSTRTGSPTSATFRPDWSAPTRPALAPGAELGPGDTLWVDPPSSASDKLAAVTTGDVARSGAGGVGIDRYPRRRHVVTISGDLDVDHSRAVQDLVADATQVAQTEVVLDLRTWSPSRPGSRPPRRCRASHGLRRPASGARSTAAARWPAAPRTCRWSARTAGGPPAAAGRRARSRPADLPHARPRPSFVAALPLPRGRDWDRTSDLFRATSRATAAVARLCRNLVGDTGFEPVTSSVSGKRATTAPIALGEEFEVGTGFEPVYTDLQSVASPLGQPTADGLPRPSPSGRRGSNSRPQPWQGCALPTELRPPASQPPELGRPKCVRTLADADWGPASVGATRRRAAQNALVRAWVERSAARRSDRAGGGGQRPRADRRRRGLRGDQGGRRAAVRADPAPRAAGPQSPTGLGLPEPDDDARTPRDRRGARRRAPAARPPADHLHRRPGAARLRSWRRGDPTLVVVAARWPPGRPTARVATVPWPRNERGAIAGLKTTSYAENVVALAEASERGRERGGVREPRRAPVRGHRVPTSSTSSTASCGPRRSRAAAWPVSPGRWSSSGTAGARSTSRSRSCSGPARSSSPPRPATCRRCRTGTTVELAAPGPVTPRRPGGLARARARAARGLDVSRPPSRARVGHRNGRLAQW